jgi:hypothetical protein
VHHAGSIEVMWRNGQGTPAEPGALLLDHNAHVLNEWGALRVGHVQPPP